MPLTPPLIDAAVERYWRELDRYEKLSQFVGESCRRLLEEHAIRGLVQWRAKDPGRLRAKLQKYLVSGEGAAEFVDLDSVFRVLKDLAGARITTYVESDRVRVIALVRKRFSGFGTAATIIADVKDQPTEFYRATHCMVRLKDEDSVGGYQNLKGLGCEIQVCSQLAHVYNEIEHDLRYKPISGAPSQKENDLLNAFARLMEVGDTISNQLREAVEARQRGQSFRDTQGPDAEPEPVTYVRDRSLLDIVAKSPLLLALARLIKASRPQDDLPETPAEFYQAAIRLVMQGAWSRGGVAAVSTKDADELLNALRPVAWQIFCNDPRATLVDRDTLTTTISRATGRSQIDATTLLAQLVDLGFWSSSLQDAKEQVCFREDTFRDFLAASHVASVINRAGWDEAEIKTWQEESGWTSVRVSDLLDAHTFESRWEPVIVFVTGLIEEPLPLLGALADRNRDDFCRHRLGLWCRCYRVLSATRQTVLARRMPSVFEDILRIAKRCTHDDMGHRKPWLEWVEILLPSAAAAEHLCDGLLALDGRYHGWAVSAKILELLESALSRGKVPSSVVEAISRFGENDEHQWGVNTALLAVRLAEGDHQQAIVARYARIIEHHDTSDRIRVRLAEAVSTSDNSTAARRAGGILISLAQDDSLAFEHHERAVNALVSLLKTNLASVAAPILVDNLLNPSSRHHFWLAWRIIRAAEKDADSPWSAAFLSVIVFADREDDQRLRLWSAQVLSNYAQPSLRALGLRTLWELAQNKESHSWVYAARWLVEHGTLELAKKARKALLDEAADHESEHQRIATAELLAMATVGPLGGPIENVVREAVLRELEEHGQKYGSRLHVSAPGAPEGNVDLELFTDNPAAVIKLLHTFNGPSPYLRDRDDPNEEEKRMRHWNAVLLHGTRYWPEVVRRSWQAAHDDVDPDRNGVLGIVLFAGSGSELLALLRKTFTRGRGSSRTRHYLLEELDERGWRFRFRGRQIEVLHEGREESRAVTADSP